jgi:predicted N-acyltransferase
MGEKSTGQLEKILKNLDENGLEEYFQKHLEESRYTKFSAFMTDVLRSKRLKRIAVIRRADIPERLGYKLLSGERRTDERDWIIRLCIAAEMTLEEIQQALKLYGFPELYAKNRRDVVLIVAVNQGKIWSWEVDELLKKYEQKPLCRPNWKEKE